MSTIWQEIEFYVLHYPRYIGLFGYCAVAMAAVCSWHTFIRGDERTGFELLVVTWLILFFGITHGFLWSVMGASLPVHPEWEMWELCEVLIGAAGPFLLTAPAAWKLIAEGNHPEGKSDVLLLCGGVAGLLDAVCLFVYLLWFWN